MARTRAVERVLVVATGVVVGPLRMAFEPADATLLM
jgi:hypothetical protein